MVDRHVAHQAVSLCLDVAVIRPGRLFGCTNKLWQFRCLLTTVPGGTISPYLTQIEAQSVQVDVQKLSRRATLLQREGGRYLELGCREPFPRHFVICRFWSRAWTSFYCTGQHSSTLVPTHWQRAGSGNRFQSWTAETNKSVTRFPELATSRRCDAGLEMNHTVLRGRRMFERCQCVRDSARMGSDCFWIIQVDLSSPHHILPETSPCLVWLGNTCHDNAIAPELYFLYYVLCEWRGYIGDYNLQRQMIVLCLYYNTVQQETGPSRMLYHYVTLLISKGTRHPSSPRIFGGGKIPSAISSPHQLRPLHPFGPIPYDLQQAEFEWRFWT